MIFLWVGTQLEDTEVGDIEANIRNEVATFDEIDEVEFEKWTVHLSEDSLNRMLIGVLNDQNNETKVRFTYSLEHNHIAKYELT